MGATDILILLYLLLLIFLSIFSNRLFAGFVAAKPEGRKTAIGNFQKSYIKFIKNMFTEFKA